MASEIEAGQFIDRLKRMEAVIREIEGQQHALRAGQTAFKWATAIIAAVAVTVIGGLVSLDLSRIFVLGDRIAAVENQTGQIATSMGFLRDDVAEIKTDLRAVRADVSRVAAAVGAEKVAPEEQNKTELMPR